MKKNKVLFLFGALFVCLFFLSVPGKSYAATEVRGNIDAPTTWTKSGSPYIVKGVVRANAPLNIDPGVIVKFNYDIYDYTSTLVVNNSLTAVGTPLEKIVFTSGRNDSWGGDTNGDGTKSQPASRDWGGIMITDNENHIELDYVVISYGNSGLAYRVYYASKNDTLSLKHSRIEKNYVGLELYKSKPTMEYNAITGNGTGITYKIPYYDNSGILPTIKNSSITGNVTAINTIGLSGYQSSPFDARYNWWGDESGPYYQHVKNGEDNLSGKGNKIFGDGVIFRPWSGKDPTLPKEPVVIVPGIGASVNLDLMISGVFNDNWTMFDHTYDGIIQAFKDMGYQEGKSLFVCYYDWRKSNAESANNFLKPLINQAIAASGSSKVNIVAHSMGGLVARSYIQGSGYGNDINNLFLIAAPSKGSSDIYPVWEGGHVPATWKNSMIMEAYLNYMKIKHVNTNSYEIVHNFIPSTKELMPIFSYIYPKNDPGDIKDYQTMLEKNDFLSQLNDGINTLNSRVNVSTISGNSRETVNKIPVIESDEEGLYPDGKPDPIDPVANDSQGDGRVLLSSSDIPSKFRDVLDYGHSEIVSQSENIIADRLKENLPSLQLSPQIYNELGLWFASPVDVEITAPDGKKITKDSNNIPLAKYASESKLDGFKLVSIPNPIPGDYIVKITGNGEGEYHIGSEYSDNQNGSNDRSSLVQGTITEGEVKEYKLSYHPEDEQDPIGPIGPKDDVPPSISITSPENGKEYANDQTLAINYAVSDNLTVPENILTEVYLDNQNIDVIEVSLSELSLGPHELRVAAKDEAGNQSEAISNFTVADKTPPEISIFSPREGSYINDRPVPVRYELSDNVSAPENIKNTAYLDDQEISKDEIDPAMLRLGKHSLKITATDEAGNRAEKEITFDVIITIDSAENNISRFCQAGIIPENPDCQVILNGIKSVRNLSDATRDKDNKNIIHRLDVIIEFIQKKAEKKGYYDPLMKDLLIEWLEHIKP